MDQLKSILSRAKEVASEYYALTGKPLGITGEIAEEAAEKLGLTLSVARTPFPDAELAREGKAEKYQIKGRAVNPGLRYKGRMSGVKCNGDFEWVLLVLLNQATFDTLEIWQASREAVHARISEPGSKARNERYSLGIRQFKSIATRVWPGSEG